MIQVQRLSKQYGKQQVINDISIAFENKSCVALIGPNGSGKTTLIKCLLGMVRPDEGTINFDGKPIDEAGLYRKNLGYMPQINRFPDHMKVHQLFSLLKELRKDVSSENYDLELYDLFNIEEFSHKKLGNLSGGMRQKVSAALAFMFSPQVYVLDEPTAGLDPLANEQLKEKIRKVTGKGRLVLITSHILSDLDEITTDIAYLMDGKLLFYRPLSVLKEETSELSLNKIIAHLLRKEAGNA